MYINIQSVGRKVLQLDSLIASERLNAVFLVEHWLSQAELEVVRLADLILTSCCCRDSGHHGGSCIFADGCCGSRVGLNLTRYIEYRVCEVSGMMYCGVCFLVFYRPPSGDFNSFLSKLNSLMQAFSTHNLVCVGDFNVHFDRKDVRASQLTDLFHSFGLTQRVFEVTRGSIALIISSPISMIH